MARVSIDFLRRLSARVHVQVSSASSETPAGHLSKQQPQQQQQLRQQHSSPPPPVVSEVTTATAAVAAYVSEVVVILNSYLERRDLSHANRFSSEPAREPCPILIRSLVKSLLE
jgi:hypothetical protein